MYEMISFNIFENNMKELTKHVVIKDKKAPIMNSPSNM